MKILQKLPIVALVVTFYLLLSTFNASAQNVGINTTGATPDNSALLDLSSTDKGFLITRADTASIASPAFGLMTLAPIDSCLYMYSGETWVCLGGVGINCSSNGGGESPCIDNVTEIVDVTNPTTGKTWMDRNLGASQVATSSTDEAAYGDLYQWGRCADGHEKRTSSITPTLSTTDTPGHGDFITITDGVYDWRNPPNDNLWQGVAGINNPCPTGYRIPTEAELEAERQSWGSMGSGTIDAAGAFASPLKLTMPGARVAANGSLFLLGGIGMYWSSTVTMASGYPTSMFLRIMASGAQMNNAGIHATGYSVRCIKD